MKTLIAVALGSFVALVLLYIFFKMVKYVLYTAFYIFSLIPIICSRILYGVAKLFHIDGFIYYPLGLCSIPSLLHLFIVYIPFSKKERIVGVQEAFSKPKKERQITMGMLVFYNLIAYGFFYLYLYTPVGVNKKMMLFMGCVYAIFSLFYVCYKNFKWGEDYALFYMRCMEWHQWELKECSFISEATLVEKLDSFAQDIYENDKNKFKFKADNIPYGRVNAFIGYFNRTLENEDPVYFSPRMGSNDELREYGTLITTRGIYISQPQNRNIELPFSGLYKIVKEKNCYEFEYGLSYGEEKRCVVLSKDSSINFKIFNDSEDFKDIPLIMHHNKLKTELDEGLESYVKSRVQKVQNEFDKHQQFKDVQNTAELGGLSAGMSQNVHVFNNEVKNYMNGNGGGGYAGEYGNNAFDRITGKKVKNMAQDLENGRQKLHGADRNVNGVNIQTKYYKSASESIGAAFKKGEAQYINEDGSMMQIEVPRDQYNQAVQEMQKRIQKGQVPGESNPDNASKYVRKCVFTYAQANNIAIAGTIEGLSVDAMQGITCSLPGAGITAAITFASAVWNGQNLKDAAKACAISSLKVIGKNTATYVLTMQLSRDKVINIFAGPKMIGEPGKQVVKSVASVENPLFVTAESVAKQIRESVIAKSQIGKAIGLDKVAGRSVIGGAVSAAIVYGPDVCRAIQGKISGQQLFKNSAVATLGLAAGATIGSLIPIPIVGTMSGAAAGSFVAKKVLDNYIEDDQVAMFRILREEFLDIVMLYQLNKEEFDFILEHTIAIAVSDDSTILQNMFQTGMPKEFADGFITSVVLEVLSKRPKITRSMMDEAMEDLFEEKQMA